MLLLMARGPRPPPGWALAASTRAHPVTVRALAQRLKQAGLVGARPGQPGFRLIVPPASVTLRDIWLAVADADEGPVIACHPEPDEACPVGARIGDMIDTVGDRVQAALLAVLAATTLADLMADIADPQPYPAAIRAGSSVT